MASMNSKDGLNARDLAIHAGHLELAKLFKANSDQPRDYEFPVLKPLSGMHMMLHITNVLKIFRKNEYIYLFIFTRGKKNMNILWLFFRIYPTHFSNL